MGWGTRGWWRLVENEGRNGTGQCCFWAPSSQECVRCEVGQGQRSHLPPPPILSASHPSSLPLGRFPGTRAPSPSPPLLISEPSLPLLLLRRLCLQEPPQLYSLGSPLLPSLRPTPSSHPSLTGQAPSLPFILLHSKPLGLWASPAPLLPHPAGPVGRIGLGHPLGPLE